MPTSDEYFAGFFDGEGSVGYYPRSNGKGSDLVVQTVNTSRAVLDAMRERFGGGVTTRRIPVEGWTQSYCHRVTGLRAYQMLTTLRPFLLVKGERVDEILASLDHVPLPAASERTHCRRGHLFDEENTHVRPDGSRQCRRCDRERKQESRDSRGDS